MRRLAALTMAVALVLPAGVALGEETADYRDDFGSGGYSGNDGSLDFDGPWSEFGDTGGATSGMVHVGEEDCSNNRCLHIEVSGLVPATLGIRRAADLSGFESAELSFDLLVASEDLLKLTLGQLRVQVYSNGSWTDLNTFDLSDPVSLHKSYNLKGHLTKDFELQFSVPGLLGKQTTNWLGYVTVDRVEIKGLLKQPTTTSTSTTTTSRHTASTSSATTPTTGVTTTSTTSPRVTTSSRPVPVAADDGPTTTSTVPGSTTTTAVALFGIPPTPPSDSGLRDPGVGLMTDYEAGMMGDMGVDGVEVLGAELDAEFSLAVEAVESARLWIALLALLIGAAFVGGLDRRRSRREVA